ncbi:hypothetical protein PPERSA_03318 [Pseudocohnilembus persalinus]|uniref:C2H2-type domain-containing protein n=1 Tax=Pseudocohnilembus persalinus TaxID=266149 RepID=A0A0V0Q8Y9_PSEPJ|nr:hypothetical protein PPERSA_03318 [Pseudocohnilembus persalinus]|eukprot:KRW98487.1 hypothetical protein PPERSA_03318 [Pseudocohnilembus persalinus]
MQDSSNQQIKKEEGEDYEDKNQSGKKSNKEEWKCLDCKKSYKSYPAFYTHNKLKHDGKPPQNYDIPRSLEDIRKDRGRPRVTDSSQRIKFTMQDKHQQKCEDNIYEFLGKLGQKGDENGQKDNTVIRGYLKKPLDAGQLFPLDSFQNNEYYAQIADSVREQIIRVSEELARRDEWEFVDPLDLKPDDMTEFSIYNLKALFYNLRDQNMIDKYTTLVVYLIWVSKELLEKAYKEITIVSLIYCAEYWKKSDPLVVEYEQKFADKYKENEEYKAAVKKMRQEFKDNFFQNMSDLFAPYNLELLSDNTDQKQYLEKFQMWYFHFDDNEVIDQENGQGEGDYGDEDDEDNDDYDEDEGDDIN